MEELHQTQISILSKHVFAQGLTYTQMKPDTQMENNTFQHHVDQLITKNLIQKKGNLYFLTESGKQFASRIDNSKKNIPKQPVVAVRVACRRKVKGAWEYLIYTRKKEPWYDCQGFLAGKMDFGEKVAECAQRELLEETNLSGEANLVAITRMFDYSKTGEVLTDIVFFLCLVENPIGELTASSEGKYEWIAEDHVEEYITKPFGKMSDFLNELELLKNFSGQVSYIEIENKESFF